MQEHEPVTGSPGQTLICRCGRYWPCDQACPHVGACQEDMSNCDGACCRKLARQFT